MRSVPIQSSEVMVYSASRNVTRRLLLTHLLKLSGGCVLSLTAVGCLDSLVAAQDDRTRRQRLQDRMKKGSGLAENLPTPRPPESPFAPAQQLAAVREPIDRARQVGAGVVGDQQLAALGIAAENVPPVENVPAAEMRRQQRLAEQFAEPTSGSAQIAFSESPVAFPESRAVMALPSTGSGSAYRRPTEIVGSLLSAAAIGAVVRAILGGYRNGEELIQS
jgi:hypothetical protein